MYGSQPLRHPRKRRVHPPERRGEHRELCLECVEVARGGCRGRAEQRLQPRRGRGLNLDVDEHEPLLVDAPEEVLEQGDVAERDRSLAIEAAPVVERVGGVRQHRRPAERVGDRRPGHRELPRKRGDGLRLPPDVGVAEVGEQHHRAAPLPVAIERGGGELGHRGHGPAHGARAEQLRQLGRELLPRVEDCRQALQRV